MARQMNWPRSKNQNRVSGFLGGPEWRKWCSDEGPVKSFNRIQKLYKRDKEEKLMDKEMKQYND